jgi:hypothetical protein
MLRLYHLLAVLKNNLMFYHHALGRLFMILGREAGDFNRLDARLDRTGQRQVILHGMIHARLSSAGLSKSSFAV